MDISDATTRGIRVQITSHYISELSKPENQYYFFAYHVRIANHSDKPAQLLSRHWIITNSNGVIQEVDGPGVVGEQPYLRPGERFEYTSSCPLDTPVGTMHGTYQMITDDGDHFDAKIAPFSLVKEAIVFH